MNFDLQKRQENTKKGPSRERIGAKGNRRQIHWSSRAVIQMERKEVFVNGSTHMVQVDDEREKRKFLEIGKSIVVDDEVTIPGKEQWIKVCTIDGEEAVNTYVFINTYSENRALALSTGGIIPSMDVREQQRIPEGSEQKRSSSSFLTPDQRALNRLGRAIWVQLPPGKKRTPHIAAMIFGKKIYIAGNADYSSIAIGEKGILSGLRRAATQGNREVMGKRKKMLRKLTKIGKGRYHTEDANQEIITTVGNVLRKERLRNQILKYLGLKKQESEYQELIYQEIESLLLTVAAQKGIPFPRLSAIEYSLTKLLSANDMLREREIIYDQSIENKSRELETIEEDICTVKKEDVEKQGGPVHGEMLLLDQLYEKYKTGDYTPSQGQPRDMFIGGFLQDCLLCHWAFAIFNQYIGSKMGIQIKTSGTHGQIPGRWKIPKWLMDAQKNEKDRAAYDGFVANLPSIGLGARDIKNGILTTGRNGMSSDTMAGESESDTEENTGMWEDSDGV